MEHGVVGGSAKNGCRIALVWIERLEDRPLTPQPHHWPFGELTPMQLRERQHLELAMRHGTSARHCGDAGLRGLPTAFGEL